MKLLFLGLSLALSVVAYSTTGQNQQAQSKNINQPTSKPQNKETTQLDDLLRGEMAALEAYDTALKDVKNQKDKNVLQQIRKDHEDAVTMLSKYSAAKPDILEDTEDAGAWGTFSKTWTKGAGLMGNDAAIKALKQGEEHGINEYNEALKDESLSAELKKNIQNKLLPNQKRHIDTLNTFM